MLSDAVFVDSPINRRYFRFASAKLREFSDICKFFRCKKKIKFEFIQFLYQIRLFAAVIDVISACDDGQELFSSRIISNVSPGRSLRVPLGTI